MQKRYSIARLKRRLRAAFILYLMICGLLMIFQRDMMYIPYDGPTEPLKAQLAGYQRGVFTAADGSIIPYWETPNKDAPTLLYFHGNAGGLHAFTKTLQHLAGTGFHVVAMEYRGYPGAPGKPSQHAIVADGLTLYDSLKQPTIIWGYSLGSGVAMQVAARRPAAAVVLEAPFLSARSLAQQIYAIFPASIILRDQYRSDLAMEDVTAPVYIMHGGSDPIVPDAQGRALAAVAPEKTSFHFYPKADHFTLAENGAYTDVFAWLERLK